MVTSGSQWLPVVLNGYQWFLMVTSGYQWFLVVTRAPRHSYHHRHTDEDDASKTESNKDTGTRKKLQKWSRGHLFSIRGGGHIDTWQPLYQ